MAPPIYNMWHSNDYVNTIRLVNDFDFLYGVDKKAKYIVYILDQHKGWLT